MNRDIEETFKEKLYLISKMFQPATKSSSFRQGLPESRLHG